VRFKRDECKEDIARPYQQAAAAADRPGLVLVGKAQERTSSWRGFVDESHAAHRPGHPHFAWRRMSSVPDQWYLYFWDAEWGPALLKLCGYAPYPLWACANGHEWAKCQLAKAGVGFEALDNGLRSVTDPAVARSICARLGSGHVQDLLRRMTAVMPDPLTREDRRAGFEWRFSITQLEVSDTAVFDAPRRARAWFEAAIAGHLDLGRPERVSLVVDRRVVNKGRSKTPGRFATEVITRDVAPQLQVHYKSSKVKGYLKEGKALRVETTINNAADFGVPKTLNDQNWRALPKAGAATNARFLAALGEGAPGLPDPAALESVVLPTVHDGQRAPGLRFGDPRVMALLASVASFAHVVAGSPTPACAVTWPRSTTPPTPRARPATTCAASASRASSSASPTPAPTASPPTAGASHRSSPASPPASSCPCSPSSPPSTARRPPHPRRSCRRGAASTRSWPRWPGHSPRRPDDPGLARPTHARTEAPTTDLVGLAVTGRASATS
jgi:hypothetical protein